MVVCVCLTFRRSQFLHYDYFCPFPLNPISSECSDPTSKLPKLVDDFQFLPNYVKSSSLKKMPGSNSEVQKLGMLLRLGSMLLKLGTAMCMMRSYVRPLQKNHFQHIQYQLFSIRIANS